MASRVLFSGRDLSSYLENRIASLREAASTLPMEPLADEDQTILKLCTEYGLARLDLENPTTEVEDEPTGLVVRVKIPFTGDANLLRMRPSSYTHNPPQGVVFGGGQSPSIRLEYGPFGSQGPDSEAIKKWRETEVEHVRTWTAWVNQDLESFSTQLAEVARQAVAQRKAVLLRHQQLRDELS